LISSSAAWTRYLDLDLGLLARLDDQLLVDHVVEDLAP